MPKHHVVFQLSEPDGAAWSSLPIHANNVIKALAQDGGSQIEVVFYGPGLTMLTRTSNSSRHSGTNYPDKGVKLLACRNAMKMRNVKSEDLFPLAEKLIRVSPKSSASRKPAGPTSTNSPKRLYRRANR